MSHLETGKAHESSPKKKSKSSSADRAEKKESRKRKSELPAEVTLELHADMDGEKDPMLLASFPQGGVVLDGLNLSYEKVNGWKVELRGETEELDIVGSNTNSAEASAYFKAKNKAPPLDLDTSQWAVGVYEPGSDTMSLHAVPHVFPLRSTVKGYTPAASAASDATSAKERRALLFEDFGASKKKRALAASAANQVSAEQAVGASALNSWMGSKAQAGGDEEDDGTTTDATDAALAEARKHLLPPFDLSANDKAKCYNLKTLVGEKERAAMRRQLSSLKSAGPEWQTPLSAEGSKWPALSLEATRNSDPDVAVDGLLLKHLVSMYLKPNKFFRRSALRDESKALGMPAEVLQGLLDKFGAKQEGDSEAATVWRVTKSLMDKLALHLLILALKLSQYKLSTASLSKDLQMPPASIANLLRQVGCKVVAEKTNGGHIATLEAPLVFPGRRRKR